MLIEVSAFVVTAKGNKSYRQVTQGLSISAPQLVQGGQPLGEVRAGDSLLMSSGAAQCQTDGGDAVAREIESEWHLAALILVLGVHQSGDSDSDSEGAHASLVSTMILDGRCMSNACRYIQRGQRDL